MVRHWFNHASNIFWNIEDDELCSYFFAKCVKFLEYIFRGNFSIVDWKIAPVLSREWEIISKAYLQVKSRSIKILTEWIWRSQPARIVKIWSYQFELPGIVSGQLQKHFLVFDLEMRNHKTIECKSWVVAVQISEVMIIIVTKHYELRSQWLILFEP